MGRRLALRRSPARRPCAWNSCSAERADSPEVLPRPRDGFDTRRILRDCAPIKTSDHGQRLRTRRATRAREQRPHPAARLLAERHARETHEGADIQAGKTIDQFAADALGRETPLASLQLALEPNFMTGNCEGGYSCAYINTLSWRTGTLPLPMETNPRVVFERLFGEPGDRASRQTQLQIDRSILDGVSEDLARLQRASRPANRRP